MELSILDPFGDYKTAGYLRNIYQEKDLRVVGRLETAAFEQEILPTVRFLRRLPSLRYEHITETHRRLFSSLYPWAGQDRSVNAPHLAIVFADLSRRASFHVEWDATDKDEFLKTLTRELLEPDESIMDTLVLPYTREGVLSVDKTAGRLLANFKGHQDETASDPDE